MLELLTPTPVPLHPEQYYLTRTLTGLTTLNFQLSGLDPVLPRLREESLIRDTASGQTYRLRGIHIQNAVAEFSARLSAVHAETGMRRYNDRFAVIIP